MDVYLFLEPEDKKNWSGSDSERVLVLHVVKPENDAHTFE